MKIRQAHAEDAEAVANVYISSRAAYVNFPHHISAEVGSPAVL